MKCRWEWSFARKMFLFSICFLLILIGHTVSFEDDYRFTLSHRAKQKRHKVSRHYSDGLQRMFPLFHPHRHRHNIMNDNDHDLQSEFQKLQLDNYYKMRARSAAHIVSKVQTHNATLNARLTEPSQIYHQSNNVGLKTLKNKQFDFYRGNKNKQNSIEHHYSKKYVNKTDNVQNGLSAKGGIFPYYPRVKQPSFIEDYRKLKEQLQSRDYRGFDKLHHEIDDKPVTDGDENDFQYDYLDDEPQMYDQNSNFSKAESLTEEKWKNYGTPEAVEKSRRRYAVIESQSAASAHIQRIKEDSKCRWPHPKVIPVTEASKRFVPHCTILHRCGDDTGCCDYDTKTCVAKITTTVHLHFFVIPLTGSASVEVRSFINHTECHCVDRCILTSCLNTESIVNPNSHVSAKHLNNNETCSCPSHYDVDQNEFINSRCRCDCFNQNEGCKALKEGLDGFPGEDQKCILEEKCQVPVCQYGRYNSYTGRCPSASQKKRIMPQYSFR